MSPFQRVLGTGIRTEDVSLLERCPHFRGCYVLELGPEDVSLLERCPHFRGCYVQESGIGTRRCVPIREVSLFQRQASVELGPEDVLGVLCNELDASLLESCHHFKGCYVNADGA